MDELPEDFMQKARALKTRAPVELLQEVEKEGRKGRGKSRRKSIPFGDKNKTEGPKTERDNNSNKYKKRDGKEGDQKARTDTDHKRKQWNKDKPRGERKFNKGKVKNFRKEDGATFKTDRKATKKPTKRSPTKYGKSNTKFR